MRHRQLGGAQPFGNGARLHLHVPAPVEVGECEPPERLEAYRAEWTEVAELVSRKRSKDHAGQPVAQRHVEWQVSEATNAHNEIHLVFDNRVKKLGELIYGLGTIRVNEHDHVGRAGPLHLTKRRLTGRAIAAPRLANHPGAVALGLGRRAIDGTVIGHPDHVDDAGGHRGQGRSDDSLLVERGHHDADRQVMVHW